MGTGSLFPGVKRPGRGVDYTMASSAEVEEYSYSLPPTRPLTLIHVNTLYHICTYNRLPEDEPSGSKHVEDIIKIKN